MRVRELLKEIIVELEGKIYIGKREKKGRTPSEDSSIPPVESLDPYEVKNVFLLS